MTKTNYLLCPGDACPLRMTCQRYQAWLNSDDDEAPEMDPDFPGEKEVHTTDVVLIVACVFAIVPTIVGIYALIWSNWETLRNCATLAFTALLIIIGIVVIEPMFKNS